MAWYQRTYFNIKKSLKKTNFIFLLLINVLALYFIFNTSAVYCLPHKVFTPFLNHYWYNGKIISFYKNVSESVILDIFKQIDYMNYYDNYSFFNYKVIKFYEVTGLKFPFNHPFLHPQLYIDQLSNLNSSINVTLALTTSPRDFDVTLLNDESILYKDKSQYIFNNFIFSEKKKLILNNLGYSNYIVNNKDKINKHVTNVLNFYKK